MPPVDHDAGTKRRWDARDFKSRWNCSVPLDRAAREGRTRVLIEGGSAEGKLTGGPEGQETMRERHRREQRRAIYELADVLSAAD
jgi:S-adenosylmethionine:diacylglycerol 3-amino-3-carboxypropyl transferase